MYHGVIDENISEGQCLWHREWCLLCIEKIIYIYSSWELKTHKIMCQVERDR